MRKNFKKLKAGALLLSLFMLVSALYGCIGQSASTGETTLKETEAAETEINYFPETGTYNGYEYYVMMGGLGDVTTGRFNDFSGTNDYGYQRVSNAITIRNALVEEKYEVKIAYTEKYGAGWGNGPCAQAIKEDFMAGDNTYDLCIVPTCDAPQLAVSGYLRKLSAVPHIDLGNPWWDQSANTELNIGGNVYFTLGDLSTVDNLATHVLLFNKKIADSNDGIKSSRLYSMVEQGVWCWDSFEACARMVSDDLNGDTVMDGRDLYGILTWNDFLQCQMNAGKAFIATVNSGGDIFLSMYSERAVNLVDKICGLTFDQKYAFNYVNRSSVKWQDQMISMFTGDQGLFFATLCNTVTSLRATDTDFGILPYPKYDENQEKYGSYMGGTYGIMICMPTNTYTDEEIKRAGAITEALAYTSFLYVKPAYYDQTLIGRDARDDESETSLDIIFSQRSYDLGLFYLLPDTQTNITGLLTNMMKAGENRYLNTYNSLKEAAEKKIKSLNTEFKVLTGYYD